jgi:hypothetical protein
MANLKNLLDLIIKWLERVNFSAIFSFYLFLAFIILLVLYYWSGFSDKINNLSGAKKAAIFFFIALLLFGFYYVFWKAGKFDHIADYPLVQKGLHLADWRALCGLSR